MAVHPEIERKKMARNAPSKLLEHADRITELERQVSALIEAVNVLSGDEPKASGGAKRGRPKDSKNAENAPATA